MESKKEYIFDEGTNDFRINTMNSDVTIITGNVKSPIVRYIGKFDFDSFGKNGVIKQNAENVQVNSTLFGKGVNVIQVNGATIVTGNGSISISGNRGCTINGLSINGGNVVSIGNAKLELTVPNSIEDYSFNIETSSGDVEMTNLMLLRLVIETMSGDVTLKDINSIYSKINTMSGDVKAEILESMLNYEVSMDTMSGDTKQKSLEKTAPVLLSKKNRFDVDTMSGDIKVLFKGRKER